MLFPSASGHARDPENQPHARDRPGEPRARRAEAFFKPPPVEKERLGGFRFSPGPETGCPILAELPSWLEARITDSVDRGDHTVFVAEVVGCGATDPDASPLLLSSTRWSYSG